VGHVTRKELNKRTKFWYEYLIVKPRQRLNDNCYSLLLLCNNASSTV
jgi:hypothetical protein